MLNTMDYLELLKGQFNNQVKFIIKRPDVLQLVAPLFHEDGDMIDIFLEPSPEKSGWIRVGDFGLTLMRLSYTFDLNTDNKMRIFEQIISENGIRSNDGQLFLDCEPDALYPSVMQLAQTEAKVSNMALYKREVVRGLFYEMLDEFVEEYLAEFQPVKNYVPLPNREDLEVDFAFTAGPKPFYLFGVKDNAKSRIATIAFLEFQKQKLPFHGMVVHEDFAALSKKDLAWLTSASDKQFTSLADFKDKVANYMEREDTRIAL